MLNIITQIIKFLTPKKNYFLIFIILYIILSQEKIKSKENTLPSIPSLIDKILQYFEDYEADPKVQASVKTVTTQKGKLRIQYNGIRQAAITRERKEKK